MQNQLKCFQTKQKDLSLSHIEPDWNTNNSELDYNNVLTVTQDNFTFTVDF